MVTSKRLLAAMLMLLLQTFSGFGERHETGFLDRSLSIEGEIYHLQVFVPRDWDPQVKMPVILFLHGAGERGKDGYVQTEVGIGRAIRRNVGRFPFLVVMPQCRPETWWTAPAMQELALKALESVVEEFNGDPERIYLTGLSMGGYGTWALGAANPGRFAALVPICGGVRLPERLRATVASPYQSTDESIYEEVARGIGATPVWVFHGEADAVVPVSESRLMVEALRSVGGTVRYTEFEGVDHNSWDPAYADPELMLWLLQQESMR